jgi:hypothetical protein
MPWPGIELRRLYALKTQFQRQESIDIIEIPIYNLLKRMTTRFMFYNPYLGSE